jgi:hypothetical protein
MLHVHRVREFNSMLKTYGDVVRANVDKNATEDEINYLIQESKNLLLRKYPDHQDGKFIVHELDMFLDEDDDLTAEDEAMLVRLYETTRRFAVGYKFKTETPDGR